MFNKDKTGVFVFLLFPKGFTSAAYLNSRPYMAPSYIVQSVQGGLQKVLQLIGKQMA
jgi:hypothetical protein